MNDATNHPSLDLRARVLAAARATPAPTREVVKKQRIGTVIGAVLASLAVFVVLGGTLARGTRPLELVGFAAGVALVTAVGSTLTASGRARSMLGRPRSTLLALLAVVTPVLALAALAAAALWPEPATEAVATKSSVSCAALTLVEGAVPLAAFLFAKRGTDPIHPAITGAALGLAAGAWSATMAYLRCPHAAASHCIAAHVAPLVVLAAVGAIAGALVLKIGRPRGS